MLKSYRIPVLLNLTRCANTRRAFLLQTRHLFLKGKKSREVNHGGKEGENRVPREQRLEQKWQASKAPFSPQINVSDSPVSPAA